MLKQKLINHLQTNGKTDTWVNLYNLFPYKGVSLTNKQKSDSVRKLNKTLQRKSNTIVMKKQPKILIFDIETAPLKSYVWRLWKQDISPLNGMLQSEWFMLTWSAKWLFDDKIMSGKLTSKEAINEDDSRVTKEMWNLFNEADIVIAHNACVQKDTLILMQDLTWKKAEELKRGDKLVGFDEKTPPGINRRNKKGKWNGQGERKVRPSEVTNIIIEPRHCFEVIFDNGDKIITTDDHYWLAMSENCRNQQWYRTDKLRVGQKINKFISPWKKEETFDAGWLSGFISGEGTLKGNGASIDFCQRPTVVLDQAVNICKTLDIPIAPLKTKTGGLGKGDTLYTYTLGGKWKTLETLGKLKINRLINKINWDKFGGLNSNAQNDTTRTIVEINDVGIQEVAVLETSTRTYIAEGYPMHNCKFDVRTLNTRFLRNGLTPPSPYQIIDTLTHAKKQFLFESNKLDYIAKKLGVSRKIETSFSLWDGCVNGDKQSLLKMEEYNIQDVLMLEEVYLILRPYIKPHPNLSLIIDSDQPSCPACTSTNLNWNGTYRTQSASYAAFSCNSCGSIGRSRTNNVPKEVKESLTISISK